MNQIKNRVIWAVDAFSKDTALRKKMAMFLKTWVTGSQAVIEPVYVLSPDQIPVPSELFSSIAEQSEKQARKALVSLIEEANLSGASGPTLLTSNDYSLRTAVKTLVDYARSNNAEMIAVGTQSKKGISRFLFGSFAESLLLFSDIPVLLLTPESNPPRQLKRMVFATDLSDASRAAFAQALELAERHQLAITLFNRVEYCCDKTIELARQYPEYEGRIDRDFKQRSKTIEKMAAQAHARNLKVNVIIDSKPLSHSVAESILTACAFRKADLVVVAAESGTTSSTIVGSVSREVLRKAKLPVWVIHPNLQKNNLQTPKKGAA